MMCNRRAFQRASRDPLADVATLGPGGARAAPIVGGMVVESVPVKLLVAGPPKTGKSTAVVRLVQLLVAEAVPVGGS